MQIISQTAEYALRAVLCLANDPSQPMVTQQIALQAKVPYGYLTKVVQTLRKAGIVTSQRGLHGGIVLGRPAGEVTVFEVIQAVDPLKRVEVCPLGLEAHSKNLCSLHRQIDEILRNAQEVFGKYTLQDLLEEDPGAVPMDLKVATGLVSCGCGGKAEPRGALEQEPAVVGIGSYLATGL